MFKKNCLLFFIVVVIINISCDPSVDKNEINSNDESQNLLQDSIISMTKIASKYFNNGNYDSSIVIYSNIIELDSMAAFAYNNRATNYIQQKKYHLALTDINIAIKYDTTLSTYYLTRMNIYLNQDKFNMALNDINKALLKIDTIEAGRAVLSNIFGKKAECEMHLGNYKSSIESAGIAIKYNPNYYLAYYRRALVYFQLGEHSKACDDLYKSKELGNNDIPIELFDKCMNGNNSVR